MKQIRNYLQIKKEEKSNTNQDRQELKKRKWLK